MGWPRLILSVWLLLSLPILSAGQTAPVSSSSKPKASHSKPNLQTPDEGELSDSLYRNSFFAFSYKVPFGWVERTKDMQGDEADVTKARVLLAVFERPPDAPGSTINSALVIAVEKASDYPGLKTAADYFTPLQEIVAAKGFKGVYGPDTFVIGNKNLMRGDFAKDVIGKDQGKLTMQQSTLVELERGYVVSFTFIAGDEDEVESLIGNLSFAARK